jgi:dTDP-4-dehydrorhamnose reductase
MKSRILLTGKTGQVGAELAVLLPRLGEVLAPGHRDLDLTKRDDIVRTIRDLRPHLIVNAAAYTAVDHAEKEESVAYAVNAEAPALMAQEAKRIGASIVHYSTDYVFDGTKSTPYTEDDAPNPVSAYGRTKLAGEEAIRSVGLPHIIFRTAWVYATHGRNFLLTILRLASQREELRIVNDQLGSPTWCREVACGTFSILERLSQEPGGFSLPHVGGTYHMTAGGSSTWYDFANAILYEAARASNNPSWLRSATSGQPLIARRVTPIATAEYPTPAVRPGYSVLSNALLEQTFGLRLPEWSTQLHSIFLDDESQI